MGLDSLCKGPSVRDLHHKDTYSLSPCSLQISSGRYSEIMQSLLLLLLLLKLSLTDFSTHQLCLVKFTTVKISLHSGVFGLWGSIGGLG